MRRFLGIGAVAALASVFLAGPAQACYVSAPTPPYPCGGGQWCMEVWQGPREAVQCLEDLID